MIEEEEEDEEEEEVGVAVEAGDDMRPGNQEFFLSCSSVCSLSSK